MTFHDEESVAVKLPPTAWKWIRRWLPLMVPEVGQRYEDLSSEDIACISYALGMFWYAIGEQVHVGEEVVRLGDKAVWTMHVPLTGPAAALTEFDHDVEELRRALTEGSTADMLRVRAMTVMGDVGGYLRLRLRHSDT